ncbi:hypothetical protein EJB05_22851, partial [Eragrostis curvula]
MAAPLHLLPALLRLLLLLLPATPEATPISLLGISYGRVGSNLPPPSAVPQIVATLGLGRVRVYNPDPATLRAFANTGVELVVGVPDECLAAVSTPAGAADWVRTSIQPALPATKIGYLTVAVTTPHNLGVLATSFPPSSATFRKDLLPMLCPILDFHVRTGTPFFINAYPYFAYAEEPSRIHLEYALLEPGYPGVADPVSGLHYTNMLAAQVDAVYHAIAAANAAAGRTVEVRVSETGWPSAGDANETGASPQNAARYNANVMRLVSQWKGTPLKPAVPLRVYMFALFNENLKPGPTSERNYGLFKPDGSPAYELSYRLPKDNTNSGGGGYNGHGDGSEESGYYSISAAAKTTMGWWTWTRASVAACVAVLVMAL